MIDKDDVEDIYFTGAINDPNKTDFFEYKDADIVKYNYTQTFNSQENGKMLIVEIIKPFRDKQRKRNASDRKFKSID